MTPSTRIDERRLARILDTQQDVITREQAISAGLTKHALYHRLRPGGRFVFAPDEPCVVWTEADRAKGQAWHNETVHTFHTYGTPPVEENGPAEPGLRRDG